MPQVPRHRGAEIRKAYEDAGKHRDEFAELAGLPPKKITDVTCGGFISRYRAARIAMALNGLQDDIRWTADRIFEPTGGQPAAHEEDREAATAATAATVKRGAA